MEILGIRIPTVIHENSAVRCDGCARRIDGTPFRVSVLDIVATEVAPSFGEASPINPGPYQFCADATCPARWAAARGWQLCRKGIVREIMRPVPLPSSSADHLRLGLCDGIHRDAHEFAPA
jgi:hypothetical protein